jgi:hypothetical protein
MKINIGDLFILLDTELYYVTDIQYCEDIEMTKKFVLMLLNPKDNIKIRKRIMYSDNLNKIFDPDSLISKNWKYYPVKE